MKGLLINLVDSQQVSLSLYFWKLIFCVFMYFRLTVHVYVYFLNSLLLLRKLSLLRNSSNVDEALTKYFHILEGEVRQFFSLALSFNWNLTKRSFNMQSPKVGQKSGQRAQNSPNRDHTPMSYCRKPPISPTIYCRNPPISN